MSEHKCLTPLHALSTLFITACLVAAPLFTATPAKAHKLKTFATAIGAKVSGYAYFVPGGRAQNALVTITREDGSQAATLQTNEQGEFDFTADQLSRLTIHIDAGDGHEASAIIAAADLPPTLPIANAQTAAAPVVTPTPPLESAAKITPDLQQQIETALARQLRPLREQMDAWQEQIWLHDILGGLGYIIGLAGLAYALTSAKGRKTSSNIKQTKS
jgi:nickel transport protein